MEIHQLETFLSIAREGQMTKAAARLHRTQPALSAQLSKLEAELGHALFDRTPKGMVLTDAGRLFAEYARDGLARLEDGRAALDALAGLEYGELSIGGGATATTYVLPTLLATFHEAHPGIRFFVREQGSQKVVESVIAGELDLGVVTMPVAGGRNLVVEPWIEDEFRLIVPAGHQLARSKTFDWVDLDGQPLVAFEAGTAVRQMLDAKIEAAGVKVDVVMALRSIESIKQMVGQGIGLGFVSRFALDDQQSGLRCVAGPVRRELAVIYRSDRSQSPAAEAFLRLMRGEA